MNKRQNGFSIIEGLLILVIVSILGFTGWYVWHTKRTTDSIFNGAASTSSSVPKVTSNAQSQTKASPKKSSSETTAKTSSSSVPSSSSTIASPSPTTSTTVTHPTASDIAEATAKLYAIQSLLEAYYANYGTYPTSLDPTPLINQPGVSGASASTFDAPLGTKFTYGCTRGSISSCLSYRLQALKSDGTVIKTLTNQF